MILYIFPHSADSPSAAELPFQRVCEKEREGERERERGEGGSE